MDFLKPLTAKMTGLLWFREALAQTETYYALKVLDEGEAMAVMNDQQQPRLAVWNDPVPHVEVKNICTPRCSCMLVTKGYLQRSSTFRVEGNSSRVKAGGASLWGILSTVLSSWIQAKGMRSTTQGGVDTVDRKLKENARGAALYHTVLKLVSLHIVLITKVSVVMFSVPSSNADCPPADL